MCGIKHSKVEAERARQSDSAYIYASTESGKPAI